MKEADLVVNTLLEVMNREHNGSLVLRMGSLLADHNKFRMIFDLMTRNTQLKDMKLQLLVDPPQIKCGCGYEGEGITHVGVHNARCPICNGNAEIKSGFEFQILEPRK